MTTLPKILGLSILAAVGLSACGAADGQVAQPDYLLPPFSDFTTENKPTKTLATPTGDVQVYDPTQDADVRAAFRTVYDWGVANAASDAPVKPDFDFDVYNRLLSYHTREIQVLDLKRANCVELIVPPVGVTYAGHDASDCKLNWGDPLSTCEQGMMGIDVSAEPEPEILRLEMNTAPSLETLNGKPVTVAGLEHVGPQSDKMPYEGFEAQIDSFYTAECKTFYRGK